MELFIEKPLHGFKGPCPSRRTHTYNIQLNTDQLQRQCSGAPGWGRALRSPSKSLSGLPGVLRK